MANNEIKTNAEIYREQRKERLAKAAKKKKSGKGDKIIRVLVKALCIILVAGVVLYGAANMLTKVFCLPQKLITVATYGDEKITMAEYNYYYMSLYNQMVSTVNQIDSYYGQGYGSYYTGFDTTADPADQEYTAEDAPEGVETWADYFRVTAPEKAFLQASVYKEAISEDAKAKGFEITEEDQKTMNEEIDEIFTELTTYAENSDFSLSNYISKTCGEGLTEKSYRELLERDYTVQLYLTWYQENIADTVSEDDVKAYYEENKATYDYATVRLFSVSYAEASENADENDPVYTKDEAKTRADDFLSKITDEASFATLAKEYALPSQADNFEEDSATLAKNITKASVESSSESVAEWIFSADRVVGDKAVIDDADAEAYYIAYMVSVAAPDKGTAGAAVRHILVQADSTEQDTEGNEVDLPADEVEKNFEEAKAEAEKILKEWKDGEANEASFAELATEKTDDTGSIETGGLYENITSTSSYVPEFLDWALADHKVGDTDIVKTDYGYHIMYFVGADETEKWEADVRTAIASEKFDDYTSDLIDGITDKIDRNDTVINYFVKAIEKQITNAVSYKSSSTTTY